MPDLWFFVALLALVALAYWMGWTHKGYQVEAREDEAEMVRDEAWDRKHGVGGVTYPARKSTAPPPPSTSR